MNAEYVLCLLRQLNADEGACLPAVPLTTFQFDIAWRQPHLFGATSVRGWGCSFSSRQGATELQEQQPQGYVIDYRMMNGPPLDGLLAASAEETEWTVVKGIGGGDSDSSTRRAASRL